MDNTVPGEIKLKLFQTCRSSQTREEHRRARERAQQKVRPCQYAFSAGRNRRPREQGRQHKGLKEVRLEANTAIAIVLAPEEEKPAPKSSA